MTNQILSIQIENLPLVGYLRLTQVLKIIPVCKATWWNGCKSGIYPKPYKLGPNITAWKVKDIIECAQSFPPAE